MDALKWRPKGVVMALAGGLLLSLAPAAPAPAQTVPSDLRVVASDAQELTDVRQYVGRTSVATSPSADCFGPGNRGSGNRVTQVGPDALSVLVEAAELKERLRPLLITDAFLDDGFGLGLCSVGGYTAPPTGFWYLKVNHKDPNLGGSLVTVGPETDTLWYLSPNFPPGKELVLSAPARTVPGAPVRAQVLAYADDGTAAAATGATVVGASTLGTVDAVGGVDLTFSQPGQYFLSATRTGDIPSQSLSVCVAAVLDDCPDTRGREVLGTDGSDNVVGTMGPDQIRPRGSNDSVKGRGGDDLIVTNGGGRDKVKCGGGDDLVLADKTDRITKSCERVRGGHRAKPKGKKKGKRGKKHKGGKGGKRK